MHFFVVCSVEILGTLFHTTSPLPILASMPTSHTLKVAFALFFILLLTAAVVTAEIHYMKAMLESSMQ